MENNIREKYPFLIKYFEAGINSENLAHCLLFYGSDLDAQYNLALEISRMLNCKGTHTEYCNCLNCNWIRENKHPAVLTISKVDNKPSDDNTKTVISVEQARMIKRDLITSSDYHRVLIFCDRDSDGNIQGLNAQNFQEEASNALLKTFEEPPENTTFIFLTKDKSDMIETIVSRAQCFYVPSKIEENTDYMLVESFMSNYLEIEKNEVLDFVNKLNSILKDNEPIEVFSQMQNYIKVLLKAANNNLLKHKLIADMHSIEQAKKEYLCNINIQTISETLSFKLILD